MSCSRRGTNLLIFGHLRAETSDRRRKQYGIFHCWCSWAWQIRERECQRNCRDRCSALSLLGIDQRNLVAGSSGLEVCIYSIMSLICYALSKLLQVSVGASDFHGHQSLIAPALTFKAWVILRTQCFMAWRLPKQPLCYLMSCQFWMQVFGLTAGVISVLWGLWWNAKPKFP